MIRETRRISIDTAAASGAHIMGPNTTFQTGTKYNVRAAAVNIVQIEGVMGGAGVVYLQFFNTVAVPADTAVPTLSIPINTALDAGHFVADFSLDPQKLLTPLSWCVSSTKGTKTLAANTVTFDIDIQEYENLPDGVSVTGDYVTAVDDIQPWTKAVGALVPKRLYRIEALCNNGDPGLPTYVMVFAHDAPVNGDKPVYASPLVVANDGASVYVVEFGDSGLQPQKQTSDFAMHRGCHIYLSFSPSVLDTRASGAGTLKAYWKNL